MALHLRRLLLPGKAAQLVAAKADKRALDARLGTGACVSDRTCLEHLRRQAGHHSIDNLPGRHPLVDHCGRRLDIADILLDPGNHILACAGQKLHQIAARGAHA